MNKQYITILKNYQPGNRYSVEPGYNHSLSFTDHYIRNLNDNSTYAIGSKEVLEAEVEKLNQQGERK